MARQDEYRRSGVDYEVLDEVKRAAIALAAATAPLMGAVGGTEASESRGSSAYVFELDGTTLALVVEGLGTKSIIAAEYLRETGISRFADIARDAVAAIINDVISVGAVPVVVTAYFATGDASWYADRRSAMDLLAGWRAACEDAGAVWGGGESPALPGIVSPGALELAGSALGRVPAGRRPVFGSDITAGDKIVLLPSTGLHANGASLARRVASQQAGGLLTKLGSGRSLGDALLDPTMIYASFVRELLGSSVVPKFLNGITGHGFLKIMRAGVAARYEIMELPPVPEVLQYLVGALQMAPAEAYSTLNMGAGYVVIVGADDVDETLRVAQSTGHDALVAGDVVDGPRSLAIPSLGVEYRDDDLQLG
ncbi:MAG TPA: AIR synthase-related protein [Streptosporangiaceae bacterium]|nr:AIR synthase-related protein [Streptosporangiaceae bacterium]